VAHGGAVELGGSQWQACVESDCLVLRNTIQTDDKKERTASRIANLKHEVTAWNEVVLEGDGGGCVERVHVKVEARHQELEALAADQEEAERKCQLQSDDLDSYFAENNRIFAARVNHKRRIAELTAMREADVTVTTAEHSTAVRLPVGVLVDLSCVAAGESMLWWPPSQSESEGDAGVPPVVERSRTETATEERVSLVGVAPVEGVFVRQWGSRGSGQGEFDTTRRSVRERGGGLRLRLE
jgi:hypothetical protein